MLMVPTYSSCRLCYMQGVGILHKGYCNHSLYNNNYIEYFGLLTINLIYLKFCTKSLIVKPYWFFASLIYLTWWKSVIDTHGFIIPQPLKTHGLSSKDDDCDLPYMYSNPKLHKNRYKQRFIAGSAKCTTKPLSKLLTSILTAFKEGLQSYHNTCYSRSGINSDILETISSRLLSEYNSIKTYDFSTLYTSIPHTQLKSWLKNIIHRCFSK